VATERCELCGYRDGTRCNMRGRMIANIMKQCPIGKFRTVASMCAGEESNDGANPIKSVSRPVPLPVQSPGVRREEPERGVQKVPVGPRNPVGQAGKKVDKKKKRRK